MKNLLIFSDLHINSRELIECRAVLDEICLLIGKYHIDTLIDAGDTFDTVSPSSEELDIFSDFIKKTNLPIIILAAQSHESITPEQSILNHFGILNTNIKIVKEYEDENYLYIGHFVLKESKYNYGAIQTKYAFDKYKYVVLGHQHDYETIPKNICHIGSCRRVDFSEDAKLPKKVAVCLNYKTKDEKWVFPSMLSPYPLINIELGQKESNLTLGSPTNDDNSKTTKDTNKQKSTMSQAQNPSNPSVFMSISDLSMHLDKIDPETKVRVIFNDYALWREFLPHIETYKNKFRLFREKNNFTIQLDNVISEKLNNSFAETLKEYLEQNKIDEKIKQILLDEIKEVR